MGTIRRLAYAAVPFPRNMSAGSLSQRLTRFDVYRKVPNDLSEGTVPGAIISIIGGALILLLFTTELLNYMHPDPRHEMVVEPGDMGERLPIYINVSVHKIPCAVLSLDVQDIMGSHVVDVGGDLVKQPITSTGEAYGTATPAAQHIATNEAVEAAKNDVAEKRGCRLEGHILVNKVPGNFHISVHGHGQEAAALYRFANELDMTHTVHRLSFGEDLPEDSGVPTETVYTLNEKKRIARPQQFTTYEYYLDVVPTYVHRSAGSAPITAYQYVANTNILHQGNVPALYFRYHISAISVRYTHQSQSFFHFLVQICAIIGGVFTVAGIIDSIFHRSVYQMVKKAQMGKLG